MKGNLKKALENVDITYEQLSEIAKSILKPQVEEINKVVDQMSNVKDLTDSQIRNLIVLLSVKSYNFSESREYATLKLTCAEAIRKEEHAKVFAATEGTAGAKENAAVTETTDEIMTEAIYELVVGILKTKVDEAHRIVDSLKSVLMSRMTEAKIAAQYNSDKAAFE